MGLIKEKVEGERKIGGRGGKGRTRGRGTERESEDASTGEEEERVCPAFRLYGSVRIDWERGGRGMGGRLKRDEME